MYGKGLALTLACTSPLFLQPAVHFARFLAAGCTPAMHFDQFLAGSRALRTFSCRGAISCKDLGEVHVERPAGRPFRRALPPFPCRHPCTSPVSLHEFASMQGFRGSAHHRAGIKGKCTASCRNKGEVHVSPAAARPSSRAFPQISASRRKVRTQIGPGGRTFRNPIQNPSAGSAVRSGEPLPQAGNDVACKSDHYRRRAVGEPLRTDNPAGGQRCGVWAKPLPPEGRRRTPSGGRTPKREGASCRPGEPPSGRPAAFDEALVGGQSDTSACLMSDLA